MGDETETQAIFDEAGRISEETLRRLEDQLIYEDTRMNIGLRSMRNFREAAATVTPPQDPAREEVDHWRREMRRLEERGQRGSTQHRIYIRIDLKEPWLGWLSLNGILQ